jgi:hypothetical protein
VRVKCGTCRGRGTVEAPDTEVVTVDGISYKVHHWRGRGTTVETPCSCFGSKMRAHSTENCPWLARRAKKKRRIP